MAIYENEIKNAEKLLQNVKSYEGQILVANAEMQSGKTGSMIAFAEKMEKDPLFSKTTILFTTGLPDIQARKGLEERFSNSGNVDIKPLKKITADMSKEAFLEDVQEWNISTIIIDEGHYALGEDSRLSDLIVEKVGYVKEMTDRKITLIFLGATNYVWALNKQTNPELAINLIELQEGEGYKGVEFFMKNGNVTNLPENFSYFTMADKKVTAAVRRFLVKKGHTPIHFSGYVNPEILNPLKNLINENENGLYILRVGAGESTRKYTEAADNLNVILHEILHGTNTSIVKAYGEDISYKVNEAKKKARFSNVILIVVGGMSASVDLTFAKPYIKMAVETRRAYASTVQGLVGRTCGYDINENVKIFCQQGALELHMAFSGDNPVSLKHDLLKLCKEKGDFTVSTHVAVKKQSTRIRNHYDIYTASAYKLNINEVSVEEIRNMFLSEGYTIDEVDQMEIYNMVKQTMRLSRALNAGKRTTSVDRRLNHEYRFETHNSLNKRKGSDVEEHYMRLEEWAKGKTIQDFKKVSKQYDTIAAIWVHQNEPGSVYYMIKNSKSCGNTSDFKASYKDSTFIKSI